MSALIPTLVPIKVFKYFKNNILVNRAASLWYLPMDEGWINMIVVSSDRNATLQTDFDRASRRIGDLETENADLKARLDNSSIQLAQRNKENAQLKKQLEDAENQLKAATVDVATLRNRLESCKYQLIEFF